MIIKIRLVVSRTETTFLCMVLTLLARAAQACPINYCYWYGALETGLLYFEGCLPGNCVRMTGLYQRQIHLHSTTRAVRCSRSSSFPRCPLSDRLSSNHPQYGRINRITLVIIACSSNCIVIGSFVTCS